MRSVVITGVNGQLGKRFVENFIEKGDRVFGLDLSDCNLEVNSDNFSFHKVDITNEKEVISFYGELSEISVLVNNAGIGKFTPFEERSAEDFMEVCNVNLLGTFLMCREAIKKMKQVKKGKIVNIGSIYGVVSSDPRIYGKSGRNNSEVYSMTKAGVIMFSKYLAANFAQYNIQINTLSPGGIQRAQTSDFVENYTHKTPAGRMGSPDDLLHTLNLLADENNSYLNGQNIVVDGGFSAW